VERYPGHIACDGASKSEVVVPIVKEGKVCGVFLFSGFRSLVWLCENRGNCGTGKKAC
jgi:hypothetical protein